MSAHPRERTKRCSSCRSWLPLNAFRLNKAQPDGLDHYCRTCKAAYESERWQSAHSGPRQPVYQGGVRWDIDALIARIEGQNAADLERGGSSFGGPR
jgi:hypothetical protein